MYKKEVTFLVVSLYAWSLSAVPGVLLGWSLVGVLLSALQEAKGGSLVSPKVHPFHAGQELRGPHLMNRRTCPPWQTPPGAGFTTGSVCTGK